jgi:hypothetical protein
MISTGSAGKRFSAQGDAASSSSAKVSDDQVSVMSARSRTERVPSEAGDREGGAEKAGSRMARYARLIDIMSVPCAAIVAPFLAGWARGGHRLPLSRSIFDRAGVGLVRHHYYTPLVFPDDVTRDLRAVREVVGLDLNEEGQFALLRQFRYSEELLGIPMKPEPGAFGYHNGSFESGDAEYLYDMIRHFKPRRLFEIGSGHSTLMARLAIEKNGEEDSAYSCEHVCIEPFEQPWLESIDVEVVRKKVEDCQAEIFESLQKDDILFIDSSHVIRPQGDVVHEYLHILGRLRPGVIVHVHDIFTPRDYLRRWVVEERRMWNEQYLLEAFLCFNSRFEVLAAVNWLFHDHRDMLAAACPVLMRDGDREPGSFWLRRLS